MLLVVLLFSSSSLLLLLSLSFVSLFVLFVPRESDTRRAVLQHRILLDRTSKWANEILRGHPPFRSEACEYMVMTKG